MKTYEHSRSSIFLLELILSILLFTVLVVIGLNFFIKAHVITNKTSNLHRAVTQCNNVATLFETGDGSLDSINRQYPYSIITTDQAIIYFDSDFKECDAGNSTYTLLLNKKEINADRLFSANISISNDSDLLYEIEAHYYKQLTPSSKEVQ